MDDLTTKENTYEYNLTAIVLVYNGEPYLEACLNSFVNQTLEGLEILLINDVSTDDSLSVCRKFERDYDNVKVINKDKNEGLATNANLGIKLAKGEYVILVDNDDIIPEDAYEKLYNKAKETDSDICVGKANFIMGKYQQEMDFHDHIAWQEEKTISNLNEYPLLFHDAFYWNKIIKRELLLKYDIKLPIGMIYADRLFSHTAYTYAKKISIITDCVYLWRRRKNSLSMKREELSNYINRLDSYELNLDHIINYYPEYIKILLRRIILPIYGMTNNKEFEEFVFDRTYKLLKNASDKVDNLYDNNADDVYNIYTYLILNNKREELRKMLELKLSEEKEIVNDNGKSYWNLPQFRDDKINIPDELFEIHFLKQIFINIEAVDIDNDSIIFNKIRIPKYFPLEKGYVVLKGKTKPCDCFEDNILYFEFEKSGDGEYRVEIPINKLNYFELYDVFFKTKRENKISNEFKVKINNINKINNKNKNLQLNSTKNNNLIITNANFNKKFELICDEEEIKIKILDKNFNDELKIYTENNITKEKVQLSLDDDENYKLKWKFFIDKKSNYNLYLTTFDDKGKLSNNIKFKKEYIENFKKVSLMINNSNIKIYQSKGNIKIKTE